jgi:hypothetical protein
MGGTVFAAAKHATADSSRTVLITTDDETVKPLLTDRKREELTR